MDNKILKSNNYSEHVADFVITGASSNDGLFCMQFLSNKPTPYVKGHNQNESGANIDIGIGTLLHHKCTVYLIREHIESIYKSLSNIIDNRN